MIVSSAPILILSVLGSLESVSIYSIYALIFQGIGMIIGLIGQSLNAPFGDLIARNETEKLRQNYSLYEFTFYSLMTILYCSAFILGYRFIDLYTRGVADINYLDINLLLLFTVYGTLTSLKVPQSTIIVSAGLYKETRLFAIIESVIVLSLSIPLIMFWGVYGALVASIIGLIFRSVDIIYSFHITHVSVLTTIKRISILFTFMTISVLIISPLINSIEMTNFITWIFYSVIVVILLSLSLFLLYLVFEKKSIIKSFYLIHNILKSKGGN